MSGFAGGGTVLAGGDLGGKGRSLRAAIAALMPGAEIDADALERGNGGTVGVWSNDSTAFGGHVSARGGAIGGDGGTVDLSSAGKLATEGKVDVAAPRGKDGKVFVRSDGRGGLAPGPQGRDPTVGCVDGL